MAVRSSTRRPLVRTMSPPPASSEQNFRANLSQFRWARGATDDSAPPAPPAAGNPFSRFYNAVAGDYMPLRGSEAAAEEPGWFVLSRWERCVLVACCVLGRVLMVVCEQDARVRRVSHRRGGVFLRRVSDAAVPCAQVRVPFSLRSMA